MIKIIIADDHALIREGIKGLIQKEQGLEVVGECSSGAEILPALRETDCDVLVLDLNMPEKSGMDVLAELAGVKDSPKVIILSISPEEQFGLRALRLGAWGYVSKESPPQQVIEAIRSVSNGRRYLSDNMTQKMASALLGGSGEHPHEGLSDREFQVLRLIGAGISAAEIARRLSLSVNTINTYRRRIMDKTALRSTSEIIRYAVENGLID